MSGSGQQKTPFPGLFEADEGTRTLDLLHGNSTKLQRRASVCNPNRMVARIRLGALS
jgi:hypothetical protein